MNKDDKDNGRFRFVVTRPPSKMGATMQEHAVYDPNLKPDADTGCQVALKAYEDMRSERNHYRYILIRLLGRSDVSDDIKSFIRTELIHKVY